MVFSERCNIIIPEAAYSLKREFSHTGDSHTGCGVSPFSELVLILCLSYAVHVVCFVLTSPLCFSRKGGTPGLVIVFTQYCSNTVFIVYTLSALNTLHMTMYLCNYLVVFCSFTTHG